MDAFDVGGIVNGGVLKFHVDPLFPRHPFEHVEHAFPLAEGDCGGIQDHSVSRYQRFFLLFEHIHIVQNGIAADGQGQVSFLLSSTMTSSDSTGVGLPSGTGSV